LAPVAEAVVQAVVAVVPELDGLGFQAVAAPERRSGHVGRETPFELLDLLFEGRSAVDDLALP
jgi:hypothetical protein